VKSCHAEFNSFQVSEWVGMPQAMACSPAEMEDFCRWQTHGLPADFFLGSGNGEITVAVKAKADLDSHMKDFSLTD